MQSHCCLCGSTCTVLFVVVTTSTLVLARVRSENSSRKYLYTVPELRILRCHVAIVRVAHPAMLTVALVRAVCRTVRSRRHCIGRCCATTRSTLCDCSRRGATHTSPTSSDARRCTTRWSTTRRRACAHCTCRLRSVCGYRLVCLPPVQCTRGSQLCCFASPVHRSRSMVS